MEGKFTVTLRKIGDRIIEKSASFTPGVGPGCNCCRTTKMWEKDGSPAKRKPRHDKRNVYLLSEEDMQRRQKKHTKRASMI